MRGGPREHWTGRSRRGLAPVRSGVATVTRDGDEYAAEVAAACKAAGRRVALDVGNEKIGYKVRHHSLAKTPVLIAIGRREAEQRIVSIRRMDREGQEVLALDEAVARLVEEAALPES